VLNLSLFPPLLAALAMAKEGGRINHPAGYVSSISAHEFLLGKILASMVIGLAQWFVLMTLLFGYFGLGFAGDPTPFLIATVLYMFCVAAFGTWRARLSLSRHPQCRLSPCSGSCWCFYLQVLVFPVEKHPCRHPLDLEHRLGPLLHRIVRDALLQGGGWPAMWLGWRA